jgi:7-keto-8-aminopelargonate synthetase-like enzyme
VGKDAALVFSTGMQTISAQFSALIGRNDVVITDKEDHAFDSRRLQARHGRV